MAIPFLSYLNLKKILTYGIHIYSHKTSKCECKNGFGYLDGICKQCHGHYFLKDGYCVSCPINSIYDSVKDTCVCAEGFALIDGICQRKCGPK